MNKKIYFHKLILWSVYLLYLRFNRNKDNAHEQQLLHHVFFYVYTKLSLNDTEISSSLELMSFLWKLPFLPYLYTISVVMLGKVNVWKIHIALSKFSSEVIVDKLSFLIKSSLV